MKYRRLEVTNFRPFYGTNTIDFSTDSDRPVTLIFGANGGGKTSLLTAMYWCLYGHTDVDPNTSDESRDLFNLRAQREISKGDSGTLSVELELETNNIVWRVRRSIRADKDSNGNMLFRESAVLTSIENDIPNDHKQGITYLINNILHKDLAPFFFHAAEMLQFPFKEDKASRDRLRECLYQVVGQSELKTLIAQAGSAQEKLRKERKVIADRAEGQNLHEAAVARLDGEIKGLVDEVDASRTELLLLEPQLQRISGRLERIEAVAPLVKELDEARADEEVKNARLKTEQGLQKEKSKDLWKVLSQPMMATFFEWFQHRADEFPRIVNRNVLLHVEQGTCICNRPAGPDEIAAVKALMDDADDSAARRLTQLFDWSNDWDADADLVRSEYELVQADVSAALDAVRIAEDRRKSATAAIADVHGDKELEDVDGLRTTVAKMETDRAGLGGRIQTLEDKVAKARRERTELMGQAVGNATSELKTATAATLASEMVLKLSTTLRDIHATLSRSFLENQMNENYWVMKETRKIRIDDDWTISTYDELPDDDDGDDGLDIGGGGAETTLLTYAFAAATARLIPAFKSVPGSDSPSDKELQAVETYPLVVDAPFSSLGEIYQGRIAKMLPTSVDQLVLFNEATHLPHLGVMHESGVIGKLYSVNYSGPLEEMEGEDLKTTFEFAGQEITYLEDSKALLGSTVQPHATGH